MLFNDISIYYMKYLLIFILNLYSVLHKLKEIYSTNVILENMDHCGATLKYHAYFKISGKNGGWS